MRRRSLLALMVVPLFVGGCGTGDDDKEIREVDPSAQVTFSLAEREWLLSSPEQQQKYCQDYRSDKIQSVRYFAFGEDAGEGFVEDFLDLLKRRC